MLRKILVYGILAGLIAGVPLSVLVIAMAHRPMMSGGMIIGYLIMLVALSTIFVAIKRRRDIDLGGVIRFWPAFGLGLGISFIAGILYVASWEFSTAITHTDFASGYADALIAQQKAKGVSGPALAAFIADMQHFKTRYADPFYRLPMTFVEIFPVGVLVSLISAGLLRNSSFLSARPDPANVKI